MGGVSARLRYCNHSIGPVPYACSMKGDVVRESRGMAKRSPHAGRSAEISLGLRAARTLAIVRRLHEGHDISSEDRAEVETMRDALASAAAAIGSAPDGGRPPGRRNIASVGLTLATFKSIPEERRERVRDHISSLVDDLDRVARREKLTDAGALLQFLKGLTSVAEQATSRQGETLVSAKG